MKQAVYLLTIFAGLISACNQTSSNIKASADFSSEYDILERMKGQKAAIDTLFNYSTGSLAENLTAFVKLEATDEILHINIRNDTFLQEGDFTTIFNILKDSLGQIISISEFPQSKSGDWYLVFSHYFDKDGNVFAFERQTNYFMDECTDTSECTERVAYETKTEFYSSKFELIETEYKLVDMEDKPIQSGCCYFPYNFEYTVSKSVSEYLEYHNLPSEKVEKQ